MEPFFKEISKIEYKGKDSNDPLSFRYYDAEKIVAGKKMKDHMKFSAAYWHTMNFLGSDPFGNDVFIRPWEDLEDPMAVAEQKVYAFFEFLEKSGIEYFCFHDRDIAPEGQTLRESNENLDKIVAIIKKEMERTGKKLLWGTANLFSNPRFVHGASTSCSAEVFAYAGAQVKKALEITKELNGQAYVFWGGREGYETLLNTRTGFEQENFARFLKMAFSYADEIGFEGDFFIEPKPKEPTKHQYDFDAATVIGFAFRHGLQDRIKLNIETNHATLAGHTVEHELRIAADAGMLGSIDANQGDLLLGWDTDQFPTDLYVTTKIMFELLNAGGFDKGGLNFDAKLRRGSFEADDIFLGHVAGMDAFAKGLLAAEKMISDGQFEDFIEKRYASFNSDLGKNITDNKLSLANCEKLMLDYAGDFGLSSGRQEYLEALLNRYITE